MYTMAFTSKPNCLILIKVTISKTKSFASKENTCNFVGKYFELTIGLLSLNRNLKYAKNVYECFT